MSWVELLAAALANMGERFGFYTMMAILVLFLQAKFGLSGTHAGLMVMAAGYMLIALPTPTPSPNPTLFLVLSCVGLFVIAFGNGLFKGNLQALVGQMYDNEQYGKMRDSGFSLFYMFINVGALFSPVIAVGMRNAWLARHGFQYNAGLPELCHAHLNGSINPEAAQRLAALAAQVSAEPPADLTAFAGAYLDVFTQGFHYAFGIAVVAMLVSLGIYLSNKRKFPTPAPKAAKKDVSAAAGMDTREIRQRMYALFAVFGVVIFFWFSFHQNGLTLTCFAKDYTDLSAIHVDLGLFSIQGAEIFQSINPLFIVVLTPIIMGLFGWLRARGREPSTPKKIAIGMGIAAAAYLLMTVGSLGVPLKAEVDAVGGLADAARVTPFLLIGTYFILTVADLADLGRVRGRLRAVDADHAADAQVAGARGQVAPPPDQGQSSPQVSLQQASSKLVWQVVKPV